MRGIELEIDQLVGYARVGAEKNRIDRVSSTKFSVKTIDEGAGEQAAPVGAQVQQA